MEEVGESAVEKFASDCTHRVILPCLLLDHAMFVMMQGEWRLRGVAGFREGF